MKTTYVQPETIIIGVDMPLTLMAATTQGDYAESKQFTPDFREEVTPVAPIGSKTVWDE